ncbi:hypothetical protein EI165_08410 [Pseudoalteromonas nigrifaciens]|uniref:hypothetical protein n=1 Tax=Pseudoalteromonas nigrifaciens TaxID=28109 RepID=UPI001787D69B|nr:hypothetical protein [Pseudoalteromonas nigrifaciens]MBE0420145.1 hypothetical protein [Pseudoalteromonas nigrifaciens]
MYNLCLVGMSLVIAKEYDALKATIIADLGELDLNVANPVDGFIVNALMAAQQYDGFPSDYKNCICFANDEVGTEVFVTDEAPVTITKDTAQAYIGIIETINVKNLLTLEMSERLCEYFNMLEGDYIPHTKRLISIVNALTHKE